MTIKEFLRGCADITVQAARAEGAAVTAKTSMADAFGQAVEAMERWV